MMVPINLAEPSKVVYRAKDGTEEKVFDALEWLAAMCSHIPDRGESRRWREYGITVIIVTFPGENTSVGDVVSRVAKQLTAPQERKDE
jgi:hypothetical protein